MKCSVCGKTESDIKKIVDNILVKLQEALEANNVSINASQWRKLSPNMRQRMGSLLKTGTVWNL